MSAVPALRCIEELEAASQSPDTIESTPLPRSDLLTRLRGLWSALEAKGEVDAHQIKNRFHLFGINSITLLYTNLKKHICLTRYVLLHWCECECVSTHTYDMTRFCGLITAFLC
jgi:hypothetical protein